MRIYRRLCFFLLLLLAIAPYAQAQDSRTYCFTDTARVKRCYPTLQEAKNGFLAQPNTAKKMKPAKEALINPALS